MEDLSMDKAILLARLKDLTFRDEATDPDGFWNDVTLAGENATGHVIDFDKCIKQLIEEIENGS
jgi:hypothetical protein